MLASAIEKLATKIEKVEAGFKAKLKEVCEAQTHDLCTRIQQGTQNAFGALLGISGQHGRIPKNKPTCEIHIRDTKRSKLAEEVFHYKQYNKTLVAALQDNLLKLPRKQLL